MRLGHAGRGGPLWLSGALFFPRQQGQECEQVTFLSTASAGWNCVGRTVVPGGGRVMERRVKLGVPQGGAVCWQGHWRDTVKGLSICLCFSPHSTSNLPVFLLPSLRSCSHLPPAPSPRSPPRCCLAPASAAKFPEAVLAAGLTPDTPADILALERKEARCTPMRKGDDWTQMLRDTIENLSRQWQGHFQNTPE